MLLSSGVGGWFVGGWTNWDFWSEVGEINYPTPCKLPLSSFLSFLSECPIPRKPRYLWGAMRLSCISWHQVLFLLLMQISEFHQNTFRHSLTLLFSSSPHRLSMAGFLPNWPSLLKSKAFTIARRTKPINRLPSPGSYSAHFLTLAVHAFYISKELHPLAIRTWTVLLIAHVPMGLQQALVALDLD